MHMYLYKIQNFGKFFEAVLSCFLPFFFAYIKRNSTFLRGRFYFVGFLFHEEITPKETASGDAEANPIRIANPIATMTWQVWICFSLETVQSPWQILHTRFGDDGALPPLFERTRHQRTNSIALFYSNNESCTFSHFFPPNDVVGGVALPPSSLHRLIFSRKTHLKLPHHSCF